MQSCSNSSMAAGQCSCGLFHHHHHPMLFALPYDDPVDCTLSLATPSARFTNLNESAPNCCWDFFQPSAAPPSHKAGRGGHNVSGAAADPLLARRCANCDTTSTPLWRNGPRGPKSLCNACGIRYKKEERRANAAATAVAGGGDSMDVHHQQMMNGNQWVHHQSHKTPSFYSPAGIGNEFRFIDDVDDRDSSFLAWRLNVTDRPGLVHDFTQ